MQEPYNVSHEVERKRALSMVLSQTKQQERRDAEVGILSMHLSTLNTYLIASFQQRFNRTLGCVCELSFLSLALLKLAFI